ncbi:MAG: impB/mucB/samB family [Rhodobacteraceae bacterium HLUCCA12]|nr:MAG: impB/mucB/samB family [Rhodobacteraceae bacterium HLUCCA12]
MTAWPQHEVYASPRGRILAMDSVGYVDERNDVSDVLICGSHGAACATQLLAWVRPRGVIVHDAGIGRDRGGVSGLKLLDAYMIPGAAVEGMSARISDGRNMYEDGILSAVNGSAALMGISPGMPVRDAARILLDHNPVPRPNAHRQICVHRDALGAVFALDTVKYADDRIAGGVLCMGSHAARAMADYVREMSYPLAGVITNDAGRARDDSGIEGLGLLDASAMPACAVSVQTARMGDARATYFDGRISALNRTAAALGIKEGDSARSAARRMLENARHSAIGEPEHV